MVLVASRRSYKAVCSEVIGVENNPANLALGEWVRERNEIANMRLQSRDVEEWLAEQRSAGVTADVVSDEIRRELRLLKSEVVMTHS